MSSTAAPSITPAKSSSERFPSLDGLRAISITLVVLGHAGAAMPADAGWLHTILRDRGGAALGVSVFFVLSGYLITRLLLAEDDKYGAISLSRFYVRRVFRIVPAYYLYIGCIAVLVSVGVLQLPVRAFLAAATFTWNYGLGDGGGSTWYFGHAWSLSIEEQFYLFWPLLLVVSGRRRARVAALAIIAAEPFIRVAWYFAFPASRAFIPVMGHTRMDILLFGCVLALLEDSAAGDAWLRRWVTSRGAAVALIALIGNVALMGALRGIYALPFGYSVEGTSIAYLMFWTMNHPGGAVRRVLNAGPVTWLGRLSYSLYLWQQAFLARDAWSERVFRFPIGVLAAVATAALSYYLVETPMLRVRDRLLRRARRVPAIAPADPAT